MKNNAEEITRYIKSGTPVYTFATIDALNKETGSTESITVSPSDFRSAGNKYTQNGGYNFPIGNVLSKSVSLSIFNQDHRFDKYDLIGAKIILQSWIFTPDNRRIDVPEGLFFISDVQQSSYQIDVTAFDAVSETDTIYGISTVGGTGQLIYPTLWDYFVFICDEVLREKLGIAELPTGVHLYSPTLKRDHFPNSDMAMPEIQREGNPKTTLRDILGYIAQIACGNIIVRQAFNATLGDYSYIDILSYDLLDFTIYSGGKFNEDVSTVYDAGTFSNPAANRLIAGDISDYNYFVLNDYPNPPTLGYLDTKYTGVTITYPVVNSKESGSASYTEQTAAANTNVLTLENPLCQSSGSADTKIIGIAHTIYDRVCESSIKPFDGSFPCNPAIEFMNNVIVTDIDGNAYTSFVGDHTLNYLGYSDIANRTPTKQENKRKFI